MGAPARVLLAALAAGALSFAAVAVVLRPDAPAVSAFEVRPAPDVTIAGARGPFRLADQRGRPVVLQFAPTDSVEAWAALAEASAHFEAVGARVLGVTTDGDAPESPFDVARDPGARAAAAFGYDGRPLAVVVDADGYLRGATAPRDAGALYSLAAPVLVEASESGAWPDEAPVLVDVRPERDRDRDGALPRALVADARTLSPRDLPADLAVTLLFVGPDAEDAAAQARRWGYDHVEVLDDGAVGDAGVIDDVPLPAVSGDEPTGPVVRG